MKRVALAFVLGFVANLSARADARWNGVVLKGVTDREPCSYVAGETMIYSFSLENMSAETDLTGFSLKWKRQGDDGVTQEGTLPLAPSGMTVATSIATPGFVRMEAWVVDESGAKVKRDTSIGKSCLGHEEVSFTGGSGASLRKIVPGVATPADFDAVWEAALARLNAKKPVTTENLASCYEDVTGSAAFTRLAVTVPSFGPNWTDCHATGYLTMPKNASNGSLSAVVSFDGYGVYRPSVPGGVEDPRAMTLHINAHGFYPLVMTDDEYDAFVKNVIDARPGGYGFNGEDNAVFERAYFFGMAMRVVSATTFLREFAKTRPEWNGKLIAKGGSQGGLQASWAASLVPGVTQVVLSAPWCCDLGGTTVGKMGGWRPGWTAALGYYDPVSHAARMPANQIKTIERSALGDYIAPPSGHAVLFNALRGRRTISFVQGGDHYNNPDIYEQHDNKRVCK